MTLSCAADTATLSDMLRITSRGDIHRACEAAIRLNLPQLPLYQAAASGDVALAVFHDPTSPFPRELLAPAKRPLIIVVGDDPPTTSMEAIGPEPWLMRRKLRYWQPRRALVHASGGAPEHYRTIVAVALAVERVLVFETGSAHAQAWRDAVAPICPTLVLVPLKGGVHPIPEARH